MAFNPESFCTAIPAPSRPGRAILARGPGGGYNPRISGLPLARRGGPPPRVEASRRPFERRPMTMRPRRLTVSWLLALAACAGPALGGEEKAGVPWFRRALLGMEVGPTGAQFGSDPSDVGYAADFDGREVVRR